MNKRQRKKWLKQHNRYFDPRETWSLDVTIASYVYPRLKLFKKVNIGYPPDISMKEWNEILDKMIFSFGELKKDYIGYEINYDDPDWKDKIDEYDHKVQEGLDLFGKYFKYLWW